MTVSDTIPPKDLLVFAELCKQGYITLTEQELTELKNFTNQRVVDELLKHKR